MDEASKLVIELQGKLGELDHKVWQYRRDMAAEFTKYAEELLRNVPTDVSETVSRAITESMKEYKSLNLNAAGSSESCATGTGTSDRGSGLDVGSQRSPGLASSSLPITHPRREEEVEGSPRSPHEREKEFQGLFTPSYLPLLDSNDRIQRRSSYERKPTPPPETKGKEKAMDILQVDASTDTRSLVPSPEPRRPPTPQRRNTDEVSVNSDWSDGATRRSALRRSSSSSTKQSPRRVRFHVAGEEVLPTSSPSSLQKSMGKDIPGGIQLLGDDSEDEAGSEQIEDIEEPPPKRVSSSQALRALSRSPLADDGTQWTTVSAPPDGSASVAISGRLSQESSSEDLPVTNGLSRLNIGDYAPENGTNGDNSEHAFTSMPGAGPDSVVDDEAETSSDDDMLDMPPLRSMRGQKSSATVQSPIETRFENIRSPTSATRGSSMPWDALESLGTKHPVEDDDLRFDEEDQDEVFHFDEHTERNNRPELDQEDSDTVSPASPISGKVPQSAGLSEYSQSPAREILKPAPRRHPSSSSGLVGSYKGHPFSMPIVSPDIHELAAKLGNINSFVGSVDGRSGIDESDILSFRNSGGIGSFSGTPRSMSERMMMDELMEAERKRKNELQQQKK
ncbi:hypothetical protein G7Y89_g10415 [Cudoniella acicularis]|uniref:Uncharacterized protein n=1 Tax=Cudoniella acicularis TaxID=354080 RepID=A0A8H4RED3_9HELO|nr:hypothetical protein G7Y89_g10415 [Cudoniella acicularis]